MSDSAIWTPGLEYAPDPGYQPLREEIAKWLSGFYSPALDFVASTDETTKTPETASHSRQSSSSFVLPPDPNRICITGGASQNLACILQVYSDPIFTTVWMVAPCYYLACRIFEDSGLSLKAVPEGNDGIDLSWLEKRLREANRDERSLKVRDCAASSTCKNI